MEVALCQDFLYSKYKVYFDIRKKRRIIRKNMTLRLQLCEHIIKLLEPKSTNNWYLQTWKLKEE